MAALQNHPAVRNELLRGVVVGITLLVVGESFRMAAGTAVGFLTLRAVGYAIQQAVGEYADHVLLGGGILIGVGFFAAQGVAAAWLAVGVLVGGWLVVDGLQHLRHGRTREQSAAPFVADSNGPIRGIARVFLGRLLVPFTLSRATDGETKRSNDQ